MKPKDTNCDGCLPIKRAAHQSLPRLRHQILWLGEKGEYLRRMR